MATAESAPAGTRFWPRLTFLLVALAATTAVAPFFFFGNASGHDIQFHLSSWIDVAGQWREGVLYPRWAEWANWGFGEPRFIFYPPISWLLGAALGSLLPWNAAPGAYIWLALLGAGISMWKFAKHWLAPAQAAAAAVLFAVNPYNLAIAYYRSDYAELLAVALLPLLLWAATQAIGGDWRRVPQLAVVFALIWLCNAPEGVIATYSLALLLVVGWGLRGLRPQLAGATAMFVGFGLAAFYLVPAAQERSWVQISQALSGNLRPEQNFLFAHSGDAEFQLFNGKISVLALGMIGATAVAAVFLARRRRELQQAWSMPLALGCAAAAVMIRPSAPVWRYLPELAFVQFPWRWLGPLAVVFALWVPAAIGLLRKQPIRRLATGLTLAAIAVAGVRIATGTWWNSEDAALLTGEIRSGHGYEGVDEYAPLGADRYSLPAATPDATELPRVPPTPPVQVFHAAAEKPVSSADVKLKIEQWSGEHERFTVEASGPVTLALRLINYPAWEVRLDGSELRASSAPETAEMLVPVPAHKHQLDVRFRRTKDRTVGDAISIASAILLLAFGWMVERRRSTKAGRGG